MIFYITGMHGSGTSILANYLQMCGVEMMEGKGIDRLGEARQFRFTSHRILRDSNINRYSIKFDPKMLKPSSSTKEKMKERINVSRNNFKNWGWKAPINSLCIWEWIPLLKELTSDKEKITILHVFRHPFDVTKSFGRRKSLNDRNYVANQGLKFNLALERIWRNYNLSVIKFSSTIKGDERIKIKYIFGPEFIENTSILTSRFSCLEHKSIKPLLKPNRYVKAKKHNIYYDQSKRVWKFLLNKRISEPKQ